MKKPLILSVLAFQFLAVVASAQTSSNSSCGNDNFGGVAGRPDPGIDDDDAPSVPNPGIGDPVIPYTGNEYRDVTDLRVWGGVGRHQLVWSRHGSSRVVSNSGLFGEGHYWRHHYQWELASAGIVNGHRKVTVTEPYGNVWEFTEVSPSQWKGPFSSTGQLSVQGNDFIYQTDRGYRYHFAYQPKAGVDAWVLTEFFDDSSARFTLEYNTAGKLVSVREPAGRSLSIAYRSVSRTSIRQETLATLGTVPNPGQWIVLPVSSVTAYRYVRVLGADGSSGNIAEVQFFDKSGNLLSGSIISSDPSEAPKAFDGNADTSFVSASESGSYVGLDLGSTKQIGYVRILPTAGKESLMVNKNFQASSLSVQGLNSAPSSMSVVDHVTTSDGRSVQYQYTAFNDPELPMIYQTLTGVSYGDGTSASYTYGQIFGGTRPLVTEYNDVRCATRQQHSKTTYQGGAAAVLGMVGQQKNPSTDHVVLTLGNNGGDLHQPTGIFTVGGTVIENMSAGVIMSKTDANGNVTSYGYDGRGLVRAVLDARRGLTSYGRNDLGGILVRTNADGSIESFTRNALNSVTSHTDTFGQVTTWTRDESNRVTGIAYPDSSTESFTYNGYGQVLVHTLRNGGSEQFSYDDRGLLVSKTDALGQVTTYGYDSADRLNRVTDAHGNTTSMTYTERGLLSQMINPDGSQKQWTYDERGNVLTESNELGATWSYTYDPTWSHLMSMTDPLGRSTYYLYFSNSVFTPAAGATALGQWLQGTVDPAEALPDSPYARPSLVILPSGKQIANTYDLEWNRLSTTIGAGSPDAAITRYAYDAVYNLIKTVDGNGKSWNNGYDSRNRKTSSTDPLGQVSSYSYDSENNLRSMTRPDGTVTANSYDTMHRLVSSTDPMGRTTRFTYDISGNLASLTDAKGNVYAYGYDLLNRRLSMTYPDKTLEQWSYDEVGNMIGYTTRAGQTATYSYDERNRCTGYSWSDGTPTVARTYDEASRLLRLSNAASVSDFEYDAANQLLSETQTITGKLPRKVSYSYNEDGNRVTLNYPETWRVNYQYNGRNLLSSVTSGVNDPVASFTYDGNGNRTGKTLANGVQSTYLYDAASRLTGVTNSVGTSSSIVAGYSYTLDKLGRRTARSETTSLATKKDTYLYDSTSQLTNAAYASGTKVGYAYDAVGNRTSVTTTTGSSQNIIPYLVNNCNQYTKVGSLLVSSDKNGNLTSDQNGTTYSYDAQNRLTRVETRGTNPTVVTMAYDARNRVVSRTINGDETTYVYDGWNLLEEYDSSGIEDAYYINGPGADEPLTRNPTLGGVAYYTQDGNDNVTTITDATGAVQERYTYDVYGTPTIANGVGTTITTSAVGNRFLFTGREYIAEIGLYDYRNRVYSPGLGRFLQTDPIRFDAGDVNIYSYVGNSPVNGRDAWGLWTFGGGLQASGGFSGGGQVSIGVFIGHNSEAGFFGGWSAGVLVTGGGGLYVGAGGSAGVFIAGSNAKSVCQLKGPGWATGVSGGEGFGGGFEKTGSINYNWDPGYGGEGQHGGITNVSQGPTGWNLNGGITGGPLPVEGHGLGTWTSGLTIGS